MLMFKKPKMETTPMTVTVEKPKPVTCDIPKSQDELKEYTELAEAAGYKSHHLTIEAFKRFLIKHDIPVFNHDEVITYMDTKTAEAKKENDKIKGWFWHPLREQDKINSSTGDFSKDYGGYRGLYSGYYNSSAKIQLYKHKIPLHALKKVTLITKEFNDKVAFFVSDYTVVNPDPFLKATIVNADGYGSSFIIDFWNEPGFGLNKQLA